MLDNQPNLEAWLNGGEVKRFHQWPMNNRQQTVAEHTFNMLLISTHLYMPSEYIDWCDVDGMTEFLALQQAILFHDVAEGRRGTSDISAWAKRRMPALKEIIDGAEKQIAMDLDYITWVEKYSDMNTKRLKMVDKLELMWTVASQLLLGNVTLWEASWPVIIEMMEEMDMNERERTLYLEWRKYAAGER